MFDAVSNSEVITMRVAVPVSRDRISPVFDTAERMLVVDLEDGRETSRRLAEIWSRTLPDRVGILTTGGVDVLLCGAVSRPLYDMLELAGIRVTPFLAGPAEVVLKAYLEDRLPEPQFQMPGCCGRRRRRAGNNRYVSNKGRGRK
jgi:predicted Fe-Mo cluster-binding NifX family protein